MKKKIFILFTSAAIAFAGCKKDFLEKYPLDQLVDDTYWTSEGNIRTFSMNFYPRFFPGYGSGNITTWQGYFTSENLNDDVTASARFPQNVQPANANWNTSFTWIRRANIMLDRVNGMTGISTETKDHWMGVARLFRAIEYANRVAEFGDFPWYDKALEVNDPALYKPRDNRAFVMDKVLEDFRFAVAKMRGTNTTNEEVNKYTALALMSKYFLFEGSWQKYHLNNTSKANEYFQVAKDAADQLITSNAYQIADNYRGLFSSDDLKANKEVILARRYQPSILTHSLMTYHVAEPQAGFSKSAIDAYLTIDGLPIALEPAGTYEGIVKVGTAKKSKSMIGRDPRINQTFADSLRIVSNVKTFGFSNSGFASIKFLDEAMIGTNGALSGLNYSDAPVIRYAEVLLNYAEAAAELGNVTQADLDKSINKLRNRAGFSAKLPKLEVVGGMPAVNSVVYDDPKRDADVPALIWEIRRERRVELIMEGRRNDDLRRWKKLHYADQVANIDANRGAKISLTDYPNTRGLVIENNANEGYIIPVADGGAKRRLESNKVYLNYIPLNEIKLYQDNGAVLDQNPDW